MAKMTKQQLTAKKEANNKKEFLYDIKEDMQLGFTNKKMPKSEHSALNNYKQSKSGRVYKKRW